MPSEFGTGFSEQSLWNMRQYYNRFPILSALRRELTWTHYKMLIRVENEKARSYYLTEAEEQNWSLGYTFDNAGLNGRGTEG